MSHYDHFNLRIWLRNWLLKPSYAELKANQARPFISFQEFQQIVSQRQLSDSTYVENPACYQHAPGPAVSPPPEAPELKSLVKSADPMPRATLLVQGERV